jgi:hypothetical protein
MLARSGLKVRALPNAGLAVRLRRDRGIRTGFVAALFSIGLLAGAQGAGATTFCVPSFHPSARTTART